MKTTPIAFIKLIALSLFLSLPLAHAQNTALTYQGRLNDNGSPFNGTAEFQPTLWDAVTNGSQMAANSPAQVVAAVTNGLFTLPLEFGASFPGADRWLQIEVRTNGVGAFTLLSPRQKITSTPYAIQSANATTVPNGSITAAKLSSGAGSSGQVLKMSGVNLAWGADISSGVSSVGTGTGLTGGPITSSGTIAIDTSVVPRLGVTNAFTVGPQLFQSGGGGANRGLIVRGAASQTANLQEWQDSAGSVLASISPGGVFSGNGSGLTNFSTNVTLLNANQTFTGRPTFNSPGAPLAVGNSTLINNLNADLVDGLSANASPTASTLLPLNASAKFPNSVLNTGSGNGLDADSVDGFHAASFWKLGGNSGTTPGTDFIGTTGNQALEFKANGTRALRLEPTALGPNIIGGNNSTVSGSSAFNNIGGGEQHQITDPNGYSVIAGGHGNSIGMAPMDFIIGLGGANTIGGGRGNLIETNSQGSTIAGGYANTIQTNVSFSTIGSGEGNSIGAGALYATVPGGNANEANGDYSFAAGRRAKANHDGTFVWADSQAANFASTATNQFLIRASGGVGINTATPGFPLSFPNSLGDKISLWGQFGNHYGFGVQSGQLQIHGDASVSDIVFGYGSSTNFTETARIEGSGNVGIGTTTPSRKLEVRGSGDVEIGLTNSQAGGRLWTIQSSSVSGSAFDAAFQIIDRTAGQSRMYILTNGNVGIGVVPTNKLHVAGGVSATAFVTTSDRNAKEHFTSISPREVLQKVANLPITKWNFKELKDGQHLGPMAQDFYAAFGLGGGETTITTVDADGVALAAIQGLNQKLEEQSAENRELKQRLSQLEQLVSKLTNKRN